MLRFSTSLTAVTLLTAFAISAWAARFDVKLHGAKADGKTDDTAAFQKALDAAAQKPGTTVFAPDGRYLIAGTIQVRLNTTLQGEYSGPGRQRGTILLATGRKGNSGGANFLFYDGHVRNLKVTLGRNWSLVR